jgi:hypothetical protein
MNPDGTSITSRFAESEQIMAIDVQSNSLLMMARCAHAGKAILANSALRFG